VTWGSGNPVVATVDQSGKVTAVGIGTSTITAVIGGRAGSALAVVATPVAKVTATPDTLDLAPGDKGQLTATAYDASGNVIKGLSVAWGTSNAGVATVDTTGDVTAVTSGTATIFAVIGGRNGSATVIVAPPGPVMIQGCDGGTLNETAHAPIIVRGNINNQCQANITSTAGSIEIQGSIDKKSSAVLTATAGVTIDNQINNGSAVQVTAGGPFTLAQSIGGNTGPVVSSLTVYQSNSLTIGGDIHNGAQVKLHSFGAILIGGAVHDPGTLVLWWAPSFTATNGVMPPAQAIKNNWGGFPDQY
jgi:uncharacterized protein YjdB